MVGDAGRIARITVENFMCHSNLTIDLLDNVNFITGQNGSGKSAILTALCVAFGCKARGTQRASSLKDFIKTGCSYALVSVEMKNGGPEAFKPEEYGDTIFIERRMTASSTTTAMKGVHGRKVASKKEELQELIDHFNIDVENPCVIMSQDKSREFLHSGNDKEKFKFFYKATLLQQVSDLLDANQRNIEECIGRLTENAEAFRPYERSLAALEEELKRAEQVDAMAQEVVLVRKQLAWAHVEELEKTVLSAKSDLQTFQDRVPVCQGRIAAAEAQRDEKMEALQKAREEARVLMERCDEMKLAQDRVYREATEIAKEKATLEEQLRSKTRALDKKLQSKRKLENDLRHMQQKYAQNTQEEENTRNSCIVELEREISSLREESDSLEASIKEKSSEVETLAAEISNIGSEITDQEAKCRELNEHIRRLSNQQRNKVTAFGSDNVLRLLRCIEENRRHFGKFPIGPLGAHITLESSSWALAVEVAAGKWFNAFIVNDHEDMLRLRRLGKQCGYEVPIVIYKFDHPALTIPHWMLPDQRLTTVMNVLQTESITIRNVLVDQGGVERLVLVKDFDEGKHVAFDRRTYPNVKEVFTMDGLRMFSRGGSETTLPKDSRTSSGRLEAATDERISLTEREKAEVLATLKSAKDRKRKAEDTQGLLKRDWDGFKRRRIQMLQVISTKERTLRDLKVQADEARLSDMPNLEELEQELVAAGEEVDQYEQSVEEMKVKVDEVAERLRDARKRHDELADKAREEVSRVQPQLDVLEEEVNEATSSYDHFVKVLNERVLRDIREREDNIKSLEQRREESIGKASRICSAEEIQALGGVNETSQQLSKRLIALQRRIETEKEAVTPVQELQEQRLRLEKKISKKKNRHTQLKERVEFIKTIYEKRRKKFQTNTNHLSKQIKWRFLEHLKKKAFSGTVNINYEDKTLKLEVMMPQDNSNSTVQDTRALSGGERSFSTLCFALSVHDVTEAPFRAMDEFDVFMDQISRKVSLDMVVDFAINQGSQWIFITPHDISSVKAHPKLKKQQMSAPRS